ncbi:MAG TPA: tetratricopeptide repeat protein [Stellaceae bacterium]|nr:tetratricopeptide repeat protein [Stellaceae bacterium]
MTIRHWVAIAFAVVFAASAALAQPKTIKDPAEYNAYIAALNTADPAQKAAAMESFVVAYPNSVVKEDALEQAMAGFQQANDQAAVEKTARRILQIDKSHVRALAILSFIDRAKAAQGDKPALAEMQAFAQQGLAALKEWHKPDGTSDADFATARGQTESIFDGALGFAALQAKDYAAARGALAKSVTIDPGNLQDVYQLGIAELEMSPPDATGFWHIARAGGLAKAQGNAAATQSILAYGSAKYRNYHGGDDGWDQIMAQAATQSAPPANFAKSIKSAPSPAEIAVNAVRDNDPSTLSFSDWEYVLGFRDASPANQAAADKVWQTIQAHQKNGAVKLKISVKVISATRDSIDAAITDENQQANKADVTIAMASPMAAPPKPGAAIDITGVITDYTPRPFKFAMKEGLYSLGAAQQPPQTPNDAQGYYDRGFDYYKKGLHDQAIGDYTQAIALKPDYAEAYFNRGIAYQSKGLTDQALADYAKAIALRSDDADAYSARGGVYELKRQRDNAVADYRTALKIDPTNHDAKQGLKRLGAAP